MDVDMNKFQKEVMTNTFYLGIPTYKNPIDAWVYQEIIWETKPNVIIEIGNKFGGSALMLSHMLEKVAGNNREVIGIDKNHKELLVSSPAISWITGDATDYKIFEQVMKMIDGTDRVMVIEDSSHTYDTTLELLGMYAPFVTQGCYYIVEDTIINHGLDRKGYGERAAYEAVETFMENNLVFRVDHTRDRFGLSHNPGGYLKRIA